MKKARAYIYRNLTKNCFSVKFRGKVVEHFTRPVIFVGRFIVNESGRERVRREGKKYVHAFASPFSYDGPDTLEAFIESEWEGFEKREVTYNPYKYDSFVYVDNGLPATSNIIVMEYPKIYVISRK